MFSVTVLPIVVGAAVGVPVVLEDGVVPLEGSVVALEGGVAVVLAREAFVGAMKE